MLKSLTGDGVFSMILARTLALVFLFNAAGSAYATPWAFRLAALTDPKPTGSGGTGNAGNGGNAGNAGNTSNDGNAGNAGNAARPVSGPERAVPGHGVANRREAGATTTSPKP